LHFSHIGFTDGRTFMIPFGSFCGKEALVTVLAARYLSPDFAPRARRKPHAARPRNIAISLLRPSGGQVGAPT
jgi:hypothetical protein